MKYTKESALRMLKRNRLKVNDESISIYIPMGKIVGNKLWGAIDYLMNQHGYVYYFEEDLVFSRLISR